MNPWKPSHWVQDQWQPTTRGVVLVDDRVFLLGLDELYRNAMKRFEAVTLLPAARTVARALSVPPAAVPVEGYYHETPDLSEYFRLLRALQQVSEQREARVRDLPGFRLLWELTNSPIYGRPQRKGKLFPVGRDALSQALYDTRPDWSVERLVAAAHDAALSHDDVSLVGLAARSRDPVVLAAVRESVVLYAEVMTLGISAEPEVRYEWRVDPALAEAAQCFVEAFDRFVPGGLPRPEAAHAEAYFKAYADNELIGRCVRIGQTEDGEQQYHWAVAAQEFTPVGFALAVDEFWSDHIWTTETYRDYQRHPARMRLFQQQGVPESPLDWR